MIEDILADFQKDVAKAGFKSTVSSYGGEIVIRLIKNDTGFKKYISVKSSKEIEEIFKDGFFDEFL